MLMMPMINAMIRVTMILMLCVRAARRHDEREDGARYAMAALCCRICYRVAALALCAFMPHALRYALTRYVKRRENGVIIGALV